MLRRSKLGLKHCLLDIFEAYLHGGPKVYYNHEKVGRGVDSKINYP